jgi:hypothetical protein
MNRQLSNAVVGDVFSTNGLIRPGTPLSTGYIIVEYANGDLIIINDFDINSGFSTGNSGNAQTNGLTDQNTTFVEHIPRGPIAMAARRRRRKSRRSRFRKSRRRR